MVLRIVVLPVKMVALDHVGKNVTVHVQELVITHVIVGVIGAVKMYLIKSQCEAVLQSMLTASPYLLYE